MWKVPSPNLSTIIEPLEVRFLKQQLASVSCKCAICEKKRSNEIKYEINSKECQTIGIRSSFIRPIPVSSELTYINGKHHTDDLLNGMWCPGCFMALNTKRNVFKDEETATDAKMISSDKSSGKFVWFSHKSTAAEDLLLLKNCNAMVCDSMSESSFNPILKQGYEIATVLEQDENATHLHGCNLWLDHYIDCIRPPIQDLDL